MMPAFDLVIRNGTVATAADTRSCDIGIKDGRVVALAEGLEDGDRVIDASGKLVMPGGVDSHCHVEQISHVTKGALQAVHFVRDSDFKHDPSACLPCPLRVQAV